MVIHDRSIDRCGRLAEGDVDGSAQIKIGIHTRCRIFIWNVIYLNLAQNAVIDGFIGNDNRSILQLKTNNKRIKNIPLFYFSNIRYRNSFVFDLSAHIHDNKLRVSHAFIPQAFLCIL